ncbi:hypothetical protein Pint_07068 [Pistacia integerrima]|uniref:Uncharacterized protein n=1 Tax=Pistacia integerrima TaxID=434235 RepID=A0ACC0XTK6_9ROSI|nr:hypothetical protein Pint_07068 [Pistacia integerrima]
MGFAMCAIFAIPGYPYKLEPIIINCLLSIGSMDYNFKFAIPGFTTIDFDHIWLTYLSSELFPLNNLPTGEIHVYATFHVSSDGTMMPIGIVKGCGIRLVYEQDNGYMGPGYNIEETPEVGSSSSHCISPVFMKHNFRKFELLPLITEIKLVLPRQTSTPDQPKEEITLSMNGVFPNIAPNIIEYPWEDLKVDNRGKIESLEVMLLIQWLQNRFSDPQFRYRSSQCQPLQFHICLLGSEISKWFSDWSNQSSVDTQLLSSKHDELMGFALSVHQELRTPMTQPKPAPPPERQRQTTPSDSGNQKAPDNHMCRAPLKQVFSIEDLGNV